MHKKLSYIAKTLLKFIIYVLYLTETWLLEFDSDIVMVDFPSSNLMVRVRRGSHGGG